MLTRTLKMSLIKLSGPTKPFNTQLHIGGSKSISNRALLIRALCDQPFQISNLSDSDDTNKMNGLLSNESLEYDTGHAGTTFRFLTAYLALQEGKQVLTGSARMKQRPIGPLVNVLNTLGADIKYLEKEGYPPLEIKSFKGQQTNNISIQSNVSSQYISALCMIAPALKDGLTINLVGDLVSKPYLVMTLKMMHHFGVASNFEGQTISIAPQQYKAVDYLVESDWSSASYHFALAAINKNSRIELNHYFEESLQGDSAICKIAEAFGVSSKFEDSTLIIESNGAIKDAYSYNFLEQPDLTQTIAVMAAALNVKMHFSGLQTLYIKETNRVEALKSELSKVNIEWDTDVENDNYRQYGKLKISQPTFATYHDHRMAMSLAPLALLGDIFIEDHMVVTKSYPRYWKDLEQMGFKMTIE